MSYFFDFSSFSRFYAFNYAYDEKQVSPDVKSTNTREEKVRKVDEKQTELQQEDISETMGNTPKKSSWLDWQFWKKSDNSSGPFSGFRKSNKAMGAFTFRKDVNDAIKGKESGKGDEPKDVSFSIDRSSKENSQEVFQNKATDSIPKSDSINGGNTSSGSDHDKDVPLVTYHDRPNGAKDIAINMKKVEALRDKKTDLQLQREMPPAEVLEEKYSPTGQVQQPGKAAQPVKQHETKGPVPSTQTATSSLQKQKIDAVKAKKTTRYQPTQKFQKRTGNAQFALTSTKVTLRQEKVPKTNDETKTTTGKKSAERNSDEIKTIDKKNGAKKVAEKKNEVKKNGNKRLPEKFVVPQQNCAKIDEKPSISTIRTKTFPKTVVDYQIKQNVGTRQVAGKIETEVTTQAKNENATQHSAHEGQKTQNHRAETQKLTRVQTPISQSPKRPISSSGPKNSPKLVQNSTLQRVGAQASQQTPNSQGPKPFRHLNAQQSYPQALNPQKPYTQNQSPQNTSQLGPPLERFYTEVANPQSPNLLQQPHASSLQTLSPQRARPEGISPDTSPAEASPAQQNLQSLNRRGAPGLAKPLKIVETPAENGDAFRQGPKESDNVPKRKIVFARDGRAVAIEPNVPVTLPGISVTVQERKTVSKATGTEKKYIAQNTTLKELPKTTAEQPAKREIPVQQVKPVMKDASTATPTPLPNVDAAVQVPDEDENAGDEIQKLFMKRPWDTERVMKMQVLLDEKLVVIRRMQEMSRKQRDELKSTRKRCTELEAVIKASNMQGKPQLIAQVNEVTDIKNELVVEVTNLTVELERERTNVKCLKTELVDVRAQLTAARKKGTNTTGQ